MKTVNKIVAVLFLLTAITSVTSTAAEGVPKPVLPPPQQVSDHVYAWIEVFNKLKQFGKVTFIPGHGEPDKLDAFDFPTRQYLSLLYEHMTKMVDEGVEAQDAIEQLDQSRFSGLANFEQLAGRNASWAYLEREAAAFE
jgi:hypothetical protein